MSANATVATAVDAAPGTRSEAHRIRLVPAAMSLPLPLIVGSCVYGFDYYTWAPPIVHFRPNITAAAQRSDRGQAGLPGRGHVSGHFPLSATQALGLAVTQGHSRHWLDFHVLLGLAAPFVIAFHSSFKFRGFAGMAFWIMVAVSLSGVIGRYLYGQIPRTLNTAELSAARTAGSCRRRLAQQLAAAEPACRKQICDRCCACRVRSGSQQLPIIVALVYMMVLDLGRVFRVADCAGMRLVSARQFSTLGGFLPTRNR